MTRRIGSLNSDPNNEMIAGIPIIMMVFVDDQLSTMFDLFRFLNEQRNILNVIYISGLNLNSNPLLRQAFAEKYKKGIISARQVWQKTMHYLSTFAL